MPRLTVIAAACCLLLQILAIGFHASRGEVAVPPINAVYIALALIMLWGRGRKAPIAARGSEHRVVVRAALGPPSSSRPHKRLPEEWRVT